MINSWRTAALALIAVAAVTGCGRDRTGGPRGDSTAIVVNAPEVTVHAGRARIDVAAPGATSVGNADLATGQVNMDVRPPTGTAAELRDPLVALDVVRHVVTVVPFGGAEVRGASTIKYLLDVAPPPELATKLGGLHRDTFYADVFIDSAGRIRRVTLPVDLDARRPSDTNEILAKLVTVDFTF